MAAAPKKTSKAPYKGEYSPQPEDKLGNLYCLYTFLDANGSSIYVGQSSDLVRRIRQHDSTNQRTGTVSKPWWPEVRSVQVEHFPEGTTVREVELVEYRRIRELRPRYNIEHNPSYAKGALANAREEIKQRRKESAKLHSQHDGVTRDVEPLPSQHPPARPPKPVVATAIEQARQGSRDNRLLTFLALLILLIGMILGMLFALVTVALS
ncbi:MAG: GIY-YIG nuclease family protein [Actinomycetota bacterium]